MVATGNSAPAVHKHSFDAGSALYHSFTAAMTEIVREARSASRQGGYDPGQTGRVLIWTGWLAFAVGIMAGFQSSIVSLGQVAITVGHFMRYGFKKSWQIVYKPKRLRGTAFALVGLALVLLRYTVIGCLFEA
ncbi:hypothetical protein HDU83_001454 [Entophlyctis luteolus]|nr:hypothetical protein HDU83_001454 [Entophlyctis luteolus]KAJ3387846.1 hypothetical protein HDU84_000450 [Entophlyctis sp. JEL0112]